MPHPVFERRQVPSEEGIERRVRLANTAAGRERDPTGLRSGEESGFQETIYSYHSPDVCVRVVVAQPKPLPRVGLRGGVRPVNAARGGAYGRPVRQDGGRDIPLN